MTAEIYPDVGGGPMLHDERLSFLGHENAAWLVVGGLFFDVIDDQHRRKSLPLLQLHPSCFAIASGSDNPPPGSEVASPFTVGGGGPL